jgi:hypothetical protein
MIIIVDQSALQETVHDVDLRRALTLATEYVSPENVEHLREYLVHAGYAIKVAASQHESAHTPAEFIKSEEPEADE